ncbi:MAG: phosphopantetheine-binding protein [Bacteroidota bacterium]
MSQSELIDALKEIAKPYIQDEAAFQHVTEDTNFIDDLKINSANLVDIVLDTEDKFDITIEDEEMEQMMTVKGAMQVINSKING